MKHILLRELLEQQSSDYLLDLLGQSPKEVAELIDSILTGRCYNEIGYSEDGNACSRRWYSVLDM